MDRIVSNGVDHLDMREHFAPRFLDGWEAQILRVVDPEQPKSSGAIGASALAEDLKTTRSRSSVAAHKMERFESFGFVRAINTDRPILWVRTEAGTAALTRFDALAQSAASYDARLTPSAPRS